MDSGFDGSGSATLNSKTKCKNWPRITKFVQSTRKNEDGKTGVKGKYHGWVAASLLLSRPLPLVGPGPACDSSSQGREQQT
jgi:hypothetical protein